MEVPLGLDPNEPVTIEMSRIDAARARAHLADIAGPMPTDKHKLAPAIGALQFSMIHGQPRT